MNYIYFNKKNNSFLCGDVNIFSGDGYHCLGSLKIHGTFLSVLRHFYLNNEELSKRQFYLNNEELTKTIKAIKEQIRLNYPECLL